jgi:hypothetical protein
MCANAWGFCATRATLWPVKSVVAAGQMRVGAGGALWGTQITDPENERTIYIAAGGLLLLGLALAIGTVWWWRNSKVEHPALGPLEVMGTRAWWKGDWTARRRRLDEVRPAGATAEEGDEEVDLAAVATAEAVPFDDLVDPATAEAAAASMSIEELVASLGVDTAAPAVSPVAAVAESSVAESSVAAPVADVTVAAPAPRPSVVIDTSAPRQPLVIETSTPAREREDEEPAKPAPNEQRAPIDPLLRQQRSE